MYSYLCGKVIREVKELMSKYVKNSNYFAITESALATKLLTEFRETFVKEG